MSRSNSLCLIVDLFGSARECAQAIGTIPPVVTNWCETGNISAPSIVRVILAARDLRPPIHLCPNDFFPEDLR